MAILGMDLSEERGRFDAVKLQAEVAVITSIFNTVAEKLEEENNG